MNDPDFEKNLRNRAAGRPLDGVAGHPADAGTDGRGLGDPRNPGKRHPVSQSESLARADGDKIDWQDRQVPDRARDHPGYGDAGGVPSRPARRQLVDQREHLPDILAPAAYGEPQQEELGLDLRKYIWLLIKHRWLILGSAGVFVCLGLLITFLTTPIFRASATLQISREVAKVVDVGDFQPVDAGREAEFYQTQYELLKSRSLAERVVSDLGLQDDPVFLADDRPSPWTKLKRLLFGAPAQHQTTAGSGAIADRQMSAASRLSANLTVEPVRTSSIVKLSYDSPNPQLASKIANAVAGNFITQNLDRRFEASAYARKFLEERLQQLKLKLEESERELVAYAEKQHIVNADDKQTLGMANLAGANGELAAATTDRLRNELLWQQVRSASDLGLPQFLESTSISEMRIKRSDLEAEYQDKLNLFKPAYPEMRQLKAQIDEIDRQIAKEVELIKASVKAKYETSVGEQESLAQHVEALKAEVTDFRNRNIQYTILQRETDTNRQLYDGLLQRYKEVGVAGGVGTNNVSIVDQAQVPASAYTPRLSRNLVIALMMGLMFGGTAAFAKEQLDDTFKSPEDLEDNLGLSLLGIIPLIESAEDIPRLLAEPHSAIAEAYRSLRTALQFSTAAGVPRSLLITSSRASEGKSTTALCLATNFAQLGMRVLLVDADLRRPSLHRHLNRDDSIGLTNYLAGGVTPPQTFQHTECPGLTFMPSGPLPPSPAELLAGPKMLSLLTIAAEKFDLVIVDGPPVVGLADAPLLASMAIGTLLVVDASGTRRGAAKAALKRLNFARAQMVGAVIQKLDVRGPGYSYGYSYGYAYGYGDAYRNGEAGYYGPDAKSRLATTKDR